MEEKEVRYHFKKLHLNPIYVLQYLRQSSLQLKILLTNLVQWKTNWRNGCVVHKIIQLSTVAVIFHIK